jgi:hypothetical protein
LAGCAGPKPRALPDFKKPTPIQEEVNPYVCKINCSSSLNAQQIFSKMFDSLEAILTFIKV